MEKFRGKYNGLWRNCVQINVNALNKGSFPEYDKEYRVFLNRIVAGAPNSAYTRLFVFKSYLQKYKNARVKWTMMSPMRAAKFY